VSTGKFTPVQTSFLCDRVRVVVVLLLDFGTFHSSLHLYLFLSAQSSSLHSDIVALVRPTDIVFPSTLQTNRRAPPPLDIARKHQPRLRSPTIRPCHAGTLSPTACPFSSCHSVSPLRPLFVP